MAGQQRSPQREMLRGRFDEGVLTRATIPPAERHGRYEYVRNMALLNAEGWAVNVKPVDQI